VQGIDGIQVSQYLSDWKAVSVVFGKNPCFDEFRHKVLCRDFTDGWVVVKILLNDGIDMGYFIHVRHIKVVFLLLQYKLTSLFREVANRYSVIPSLKISIRFPGLRFFVILRFVSHLLRSHWLRCRFIHASTV
jgi:hypothetical protein